MLKKILSCLREYKLPTVLTLIFILAEAGIEALLPFITAKLVKDVQESAPMNDILRIGIILTILAIISMMCGATAGFTASKASTGLSKNLRHDMFEKIQTYAFENIDKFSSSSLVTRMTTDITNLQMAFMMIIRMGLRSPLMFIFSIIMAFVMGGKLAMAFVIVIPVLVIGLFLISKYAMPAFRSVFKKYDRLNESIEENVRAMRVVKGFSREEHEKKKFGISADDICKDFTKAERIIALNTPLMQICLYFDMVFILFVGSKMAILDNAVDIGQISAMLTYGVQILMALMFLSVIYVMVTMSAESTKRIYEVLVEEPSLQNPEQALKIITDGDIEFENVNFKYSAQAKKYALANINLHIASGQTVGIIGGTGSSKSTLVQLIPRLYDVTDGSVKIGGVDVRNYDIDVLRNAVAMVLQKNVLFSGTIKENLRWGNPNATDEEMIEACQLAQADEFVQTFPDGYDTYIEQGGTNVSGGQKQRLCIARALLKKPKILILDDSTSAVDTKTDAFIRQGFKNFIPETTKIIIAQRISSVQDADMIIVLDNGSISAIGTHEELLKSSHIYREVYEQQTNGGDKNEQS
ncbi:MAG: ABC transporter ATP-binding protein/permease [Oscillospiraceae bacterium]|nr:ABC transporter ATP-binding protein/permease [Oscillospiraceae bacterium]